MTEDTAQNKGNSGEAARLSALAKQVADEAAKENKPKASCAALSASHAATSAASTMDRPRLVAAAEQAVDSAISALRPECLRDFEREIERTLKMASAMKDGDIAPTAMLDFVHAQAVHEAGHAVAALALKICFDDAKIIYEAGVNFTRTPCDPSWSCEAAGDFTAEDLAQYRRFYVAGAAAEDLILGRRNEWGLAAMLGEISADEDAAGRGMLTVIVVHKDGDMEPGPGFFELAQELGRDTADILRCWVEELKKVHRVWS